MQEKFGAVLAAGIAVFGLIFVLNQGTLDLEAQQPAVEKNQTIYETNVGKIGESQPDLRTIRIGSFTVGEARGDIQAYYNDRAVIKDSLLEDEKLRFNYNATSPKRGSLRFEVLGKRGDGSVYLKVNGDKVFQQPLISTGTPEIGIPRQKLSPGENTFELGVKRDGLLSSSEYTLEEIELEVNDRKFHDRTETFSIYGYELEDYIGSPLTFSITESIKTAPLRIKVNGQNVYSMAQQRVSGERVELTPSNADLRPGSNTITFETDRAAEYNIQNAFINMRYLGNVDRQDVSFSFDVEDRRFSEQEDTREYISFDYQNLLPSPRPLRIELNDFNTTLTPRNGLNEVTIPEGTLEDENTIMLRSNGTYQINTLRVISERAEE